MCLATPYEGLIVHVLVEGRELIEVAVDEIGCLPVQAAENRILDAGHVVQRLLAGQEIQVPALIMMDRNRIVDGLRLCRDRLLPVCALQDEVFVEPCDVPPPNEGDLQE